MSFRRRYRHVRRKARFNFAVLLTVIVVAYVGVPKLARLVDSVAGYNPPYYEPKDLERGVLLQHVEGATLLSRLSWETMVNIALFLLVAVVWLTLVPARHARRPPHY
jgi:hypothetical protein